MLTAAIVHVLQSIKISWQSSWYAHPDRWRQQSIILRRQQSIILRPIHIFIDPTIVIARSINQSEVDCRPVHKGSTKENDSQSITQSVDRSMNRVNSKNPPINRSDYSWYTHHNNDIPHKGSTKENDSQRKYKEK